MTYFGAVFGRYTSAIVSDVWSEWRWVVGTGIDDSGVFPVLSLRSVRREVTEASTATSRSVSLSARGH